MHLKALFQDDKLSGESRETSDGKRNDVALRSAFLVFTFTFLSVSLVCLDFFYRLRSISDCCVTTGI